MRITPFQFDSLLPEESPSSKKAHDAQEVEVESVVKEPEVPSFSEEELEKAKAAAYEEGFMAGKKEGLREQDKTQQDNAMKLQAAVDTILPQLTAIEQNYVKSQAQNKTMMADLITGCATKLAGSALEHAPLSPVSDLVEDCLQTLFDAPTIDAKVHPDIVEGLQSRFPTQLNVIADESLAAGDCHLAWQHGTAIRSQKDIKNELQEIIARYFDVKPDTNNPTEQQGVNHE